MALYEVTQGESALNSATRTDRRHSTVLEWIHSYNERGPEALVYRRTGGWLRLLSSISSYINELINKATEAAVYPRGKPSDEKTPPETTTQPLCIRDLAETIATDTEAMPPMATTPCTDTADAAV